MPKRQTLYNALKSYSGASVESIQRILREDPSLATVKSPEGYLPLHYVISRKYCDTIIEAVYRANPKAVKKLNPHGISALEMLIESHLRFAGNKSSANIVIMILNQYPQQALKLTSYGSTFLHFAAHKCDNVELIRALIAIHPEAVKIKSTNTNYYPLQAACQQKHIFVAKELFMQYPDAAKEFYEMFNDETETFGINYPLHCFCAWKGAPVDKKLRLVLSVYPDACRIRNYIGDLPLHLYCKNSSCPNSNTIHALLRCSPLSAQELSSDCFDYFNVYVYPLHMIIYRISTLSEKFNYDYLKCVQYLVNKYPAAVDYPYYKRGSRFFPVCPLLKSGLDKGYEIIIRYLCNMSMLEADSDTEDSIEYKFDCYYSQRELGRKLNWDYRRNSLYTLAWLQAFSGNLTFDSKPIEKCVLKLIAKYAESTVVDLHVVDSNCRLNMHRVNIRDDALRNIISFL